MNAEERRALKAANVQKCVAQYGRKAQPGAEPNDRQFDKKVAARFKQTKPEELDRLLRDDED
ncbi:MAG TPA: hypothetical protein VGM83_05405 [Devosiaceae bacterium]